MADNEREFKIKLTGESSSLVGATQESAKSLGNVGNAQEEAGKKAEKHNKHLEGMSKVFGALNQLVPGLGAIMQAAFSPIGATISLAVMALRLFQDKMKEVNAEFKAMEEETQYAAEQFKGRCLAVELPSTLDLADLVRVAAFHFPEFKRKADLLEIAAVAPQADGYLKAVEQISKHVRYKAQRGGLPLTMDLVRKAIDECYPKHLATSQRSGTQGSGAARIDAPKSAPRSTSPAAGRRVNEPLKAVARGIQLAGMDTEPEGVFDNRSLRGAGPEMVATETELVAT